LERNREQSSENYAISSTIAQLLLSEPEQNLIAPSKPSHQYCIVDPIRACQNEILSRQNKRMASILAEARGCDLFRDEAPILVWCSKMPKLRALDQRGQIEQSAVLELVSDFFRSLSSLGSQ
jgi:hypothetical protein